MKILEILDHKLDSALKKLDMSDDKDRAMMHILLKSRYDFQKHLLGREPSNPPKDMGDVIIWLHLLSYSGRDGIDEESYQIDDDLSVKLLFGLKLYLRDINTDDVDGRAHEGTKHQVDPLPIKFKPLTGAGALDVSIETQISNLDNFPNGCNLSISNGTLKSFKSNTLSKLERFETGNNVNVPEVDAKLSFGQMVLGHHSSSNFELTFKEMWKQGCKVDEFSFQLPDQQFIRMKPLYLAELGLKRVYDINSRNKSQQKFTLLLQDYRSDIVGLQHALMDEGLNKYAAL